jgi:hypothetical protein
MKRKLYGFLALYLVVALTGVSAFSAAEALHFYENNGKLTNYSGFLSSISHAVDYLAEETITTGMGRHSSFSLLNGWMRIFSLSAQHTGINITDSSFYTAYDYDVSMPKNSILLKLRI